MTIKKYKAIKRGYDNVKVREVGEVFEFEGEPGSWMVEVGAPQKKAEEPQVEAHAEKEKAPAKKSSKKVSSKANEAAEPALEEAVI